MLYDIFKEKRCFKLVCGAGNGDVEQIERLIALYSLSGCNFFDVRADIDVVKAAKRGLERAGIKDDRYLCVSVGIKGDPHINKAIIDKKSCIKCGACTSSCIHDAIKETADGFEVVSKKCLGCEKCKNACPNNAIEMKSMFKPLAELLPPLIDLGIDAVEFHAVDGDKDNILNEWNELNRIYGGPISISIDRLKLGDEALIDVTRKMVESRKPYTTIIQADGCPMSGGKDNYRTTLQAVASAELFEGANLDAYIMMSGGTNTKSAALVKMCEIPIDGIAVGTFARKIVKDYISRDDFFENKEVFEKALEISTNFVNTVLEFNK